MNWHLLGFRLLNTIWEFLCSKQLTGIFLVIENHQNYHEQEAKFSFELTMWKNWKSTVSNYIWKLYFVKWSHRREVLWTQISPLLHLSWAAIYLLPSWLFFKMLYFHLFIVISSSKFWHSSLHSKDNLRVNCDRIVEAQIFSENLVIRNIQIWNIFTCSPS